MSASPFKTVVVTPGASLDLTTLATVKTELGITDTDNDAWLQTKITQTSVAIAPACRRVFQQETVADYFNLGWRSSDEALVLSRFPVNEVVSVTESNSVLPVDQYDVDSSKGLLWRVRGDCRSAWIGGRIAVTYSAGYVLLTTLPHDLEQACILLVKQNYFAKTRDPLIKSVAIPGVSTYDYWVGSTGKGGGGGMPPEVQTLIEPYKTIAA